jgi:hypothetical protein
MRLEAEAEFLQLLPVEPERSLVGRVRVFFWESSFCEDDWEDEKLSVSPLTDRFNVLVTD